MLFRSDLRELGRVAHELGDFPDAEALLHGLIQLQEQIRTGKRPTPAKLARPGECTIPEFGEHDLEPAKDPAVWQPPVITRQP